jgi:hypothetical protein
MARPYETNDRFGVKVNVRVDEKKVSRGSLLVKTSHGQVTRAVNERFVFGRVEHHLDAIRRAGSLETQERLGIRLETNTSVTGGADKKSRHGMHYK